MKKVDMREVYGKPRKVLSETVCQEEANGIHLTLTSDVLLSLMFICCFCYRLHLINN